MADVLICLGDLRVPRSLVHSVPRLRTLDEHQVRSLGSMPATCSSSAENSDDRKEKCEKALREERTLLAQYLLDHIFVYRCNQNLLDKSSDI
jgi:hypothetical protein